MEAKISSRKCKTTPLNSREHSSHGGARGGKGIDSHGHSQDFTGVRKTQGDGEDSRHNLSLPIY